MQRRNNQKEGKNLGRSTSGFMGNVKLGFTLAQFGSVSVLPYSNGFLQLLAGIGYLILDAVLQVLDRFSGVQESGLDLQLEFVDNISGARHSFFCPSGNDFAGFFARLWSKQEGYDYAKTEP